MRRAGFFTSSGTNVKDAVQRGVNGREVQLVVEHESIKVVGDFELVVLFIVVGAPDFDRQCEFVTSSR